jgi:hypothetical protein
MLEAVTVKPFRSELCVKAFFWRTRFLDYVFRVSSLQGTRPAIRSH